MAGTKHVIVVTERSNVTARIAEFLAQLKDDPTTWAVGRTPLEAIGDLILSNEDAFNITVEITTPNNPQQKTGRA